MRIDITWASLRIPKVKGLSTQSQAKANSGLKGSHLSALCYVESASPTGSSIFNTCNLANGSGTAIGRLLHHVAKSTVRTAGKPYLISFLSLCFWAKFGKTNPLERWDQANPPNYSFTLLGGFIDEKGKGSGFGLVWAGGLDW